MVKRKIKRKLKIKRIILLIILPLIAILLISNYKNIKLFYLSKATNYEEKTINIFLEKDIFDIVKEEKYSKTLEEIIKSEYYQDKYLKEYININYKEDSQFLKNISSLLEKGYTSSDINDFYNILNITSIETITKNEYNENLDKLIKIQYFKEDKLERYLKYQVQSKKNNEDTITYVNIGLDNEYYTNVSKIENPDSYEVIVNKYNYLDRKYEPSDIEILDSKYRLSWRNVSLRHDAKIAFQEMCEAAKKDKIYIYGGSGYRSYSYQLNLYNQYKNQDGVKVADTYSARAGYSEHQTGLAMDVLNSKQEYISKKDKEYTWLINNAYKYGYILRYPEGKEKITGYMYEEWHFRYFGKEIASELQKQNITYEEYVAKK